MVEWAQKNQMSVHGHTLVWHAQTPKWFFENGDRATAIQRMKDHIHTLVGRYKGKLQSWDLSMRRSMTEAIQTPPRRKGCGTRPGCSRSDRII